jgi:hypothetical protein
LEDFQRRVSGSVVSKSERICEDAPLSRTMEQVDASTGVKPVLLLSKDRGSKLEACSFLSLSTRDARVKGSGQGTAGRLSRSDQGI